jgi:hypothetical protein
MRFPWSAVSRRRLATWIVGTTWLLPACGFDSLEGLSGGEDSIDVGQPGGVGEDASGAGAGGSAGSGAQPSGGAGGALVTGGAAGDADDSGVGSDGDAAPDGMAPDGSEADAGPPESDAEFCARLKRDCGIVNALDRSGVPRQASCGACLDESSCGGGGTLNVCSGGGPINRAQGGIVTASRHVDKVGQEPAAAFDNNIQTKWFASHVATVWVAYEFPAGAKYAITWYTVSSADDLPDRDPKNWLLEGSNDGGVNWTTVDTQMGQTFAMRLQTNTYSFTNTTPYAAYRFNVTANGGNVSFQVAEIQLFE